MNTTKQFEVELPINDDVYTARFNVTARLMVEDDNDGGVERWIYVDKHDDLVLIDSDDNEVSSLLMLKVANTLIDISGYQEKFEFDEFN
ncbi:MAG: hypothetical protein HRT69_16120 [Flavobacteriaceae bacterium]|jgi:hypothetical protein|nr:hypothetical protein [Flavobacteriaceae bacterium]